MMMNGKKLVAGTVVLAGALVAGATFAGPSDRCGPGAGGHDGPPWAAMRGEFRDMKAAAEKRLAELRAVGKLLEAQRLEQRTLHDVESLSELGVCPAATETRVNGVHGGKNAGRACWAIAGTLCGGKVQGTFAAKLGACTACEVYRAVIAEERDFLLPSRILSLLEAGR